MLHESEPTTRLQAIVSRSSQHPVNIVVMGDSIACCIGPKDYGNVWTNRLRSWLALSYQEHSSGIEPIGNNDGLSTNPPWSLHPGTGTIETLNFGPYQENPGAFGSLFRLTGNAQVTVLVPQRPIEEAILYYASGPGSESGIHVSGRQISTVIAQAGSSQITAHAAHVKLHGEEILTFSPVDGGTAYLYGIEFTYHHNGIALHNVAHGYARSEAWGGDVEHQLEFLRLIEGNIQIAIVSLGVNDSINPVTGRTYEIFWKHCSG